MGWTESPPFSCKFTETACDLTNADLRTNKWYPVHPLETFAGVANDKPNRERGLDRFPLHPFTISHQGRLLQQPLAKMEVFVDDFCGQGQYMPQLPIDQQRQALMHNIDKIFWPNNKKDDNTHKQPISPNKLQKQDASFQDIKCCLKAGIMLPNPDIF